VRPDTSVIVMNGNALEAIWRHQRQRKHEGKRKNKTNGDTAQL